ncbi:MAG: nucleoside triphosphate pyrophosphohydrolase [Terriglobales bacterium]
MHNEDSIDAGFSRVAAIMHRLRAPDGCPCDRKQTFDSIRPHTLEEAYEVFEAISDRNWTALREELGDLLLQVFFYAEIAAEQRLLTLAEVVRELGEKLVRRHPHVFAEGGSASSPEEALGRWNAIKEQENGGPRRGSLMDGIPRELPALAEALKRGQRAATAGFDWPDAEAVAVKVEEEWQELRAEMAAAAARPAPGNPAQAGPAPQGPAPIELELGDLLFTVANLARHLGLDPESALKHASRKFQRRFQAMEAQAPRLREQHPGPQQWEELWQQAKQSDPTA